MSDRSRWQIPFLAVHAIVLMLLGCFGRTSAAAATQAVAPTASLTPKTTGTTFYVSPAGSDSALGTSAAPWRTIQKAADTLHAGQTAIVAAGNYGERVAITHSGTHAEPIALQAANQARVQLLGFDLTGSNWVLSGFDI